MFALYVIAIVTLILLITSWHQKRTNAFCKSNKRLDGKTTIVTGGTAGMGLEIAKDFARRGAKVIIACPFNDEGNIAEEEIRKVTGNKHVFFKHLDLASLKSVRKFADSILKHEDRLDILVNNAGVGVPNRPVTEDGLDFVIQVNYYGHFLLTLLLLPLLKKTGESRIVNTSSIMRYLVPLGTLFVPIGVLSRCLSYSKSKYYMLPFSRELSKRLKDTKVTVNSVDPGAVGTGIFSSTNVVFGFIVTQLFKICFKTAKEGAQTAIHVAVDDSVAGVTGELFTNCQWTHGLTPAYDDKFAMTLWEDSVRLVGLSNDELENSFR